MTVRDMRRAASRPRSSAVCRRIAVVAAALLWLLLCCSRSRSRRICSQFSARASASAGLPEDVLSPARPEAPPEPSPSSARARCATACCRSRRAARYSAAQLSASGVSRFGCSVMNCFSPSLNPFAHYKGIGGAVT